MKGLLIIAPLILVIALGMVLRAAGFMNEPDKDRLTKLLYWIVLPMLLFRTTYLAGGDVAQQGNLFIANHAAMLAVQVVALLIAVPLTHRGDRPRQAVSVMAAARSNNVYLGLPVCTLALQNAGTEAASIFLAVTLPGYNLISILWGEVIRSGGIGIATLRSISLRILKNPLILSSLTGLIAAQLRLPVPGTIMTSMKLVSDMAIGIALLSLGISLEFSGLAGAFRRAWHDALIKLILHPALTWAFLTIWPVPEIFLRVSVIITAMPTAVNTFIVAKGMKLDDRYASEIVAVSTILAPMTIPVWIALLGIK
ncbi:MAG: AEC family transporter [Synergistaceae bacterium]|nr:AEC family transporter [Synergistaceae bacterium]